MWQIRLKSRSLAGNTIARGSFDGCLSVTATKFENDTSDFAGFDGQYCFVSMMPIPATAETTTIKSDMSKINLLPMGTMPDLSAMLRPFASIPPTLPKPDLPTVNHRHALLNLEV
jgi:hypothetical protein